MSFLVDLALLLISAKLLGELAERLQLPSSIGYLTAGVVLGPLLASVGAPVLELSHEIEVFGEIGAILLLFTAGVREINMRPLLANQVATTASGFLGYLFPFIITILVTTTFGLGDPTLSMTFPQILILVAAVASSSIAPTVKNLIHLNQLNTVVGRTVISAGILDNLGSMVAFTIVLEYLTTSFLGPKNLIGIVSVAIIFFLIFLIAQRVVPVVFRRTKELKVEEAEFTLAILVMLFLAYLSQLFGFHAIIGAFLAGIVISKTRLKEGGFLERLSSLSYGVFVPLFFAWAGMLLVFPAFHPFIVYLIIGVLFFNFVGSYIGARLGNISHKESMGIGVGMLPRGGIDLVVLTAGKTLGILVGSTGEMLYFTAVLLIYVSTFLTPLLLKAVMRPVKG